MVPLGQPVDQSSMIQALGNIQQNVDAADARVQEAGNQVISTMQEALHQSDKTNQDVAGRLPFAMERIEALTKGVEKLETHNHQSAMVAEKVHNSLQKGVMDLEKCFKVDQDSVFQALGNMQQTVEAADARVQQASDQVILTLQEALNQSDKTNQELAGRLSLAINRIEALENRVKKIEKDSFKTTLAHGMTHHHLMQRLIDLEKTTLEARNAYYCKNYDQIFGHLKK